ncbi:MAG TPA: DeoR/GlpR transcriptional regulator [Clostridiales bacterium]|nr:DeoR/GlpR transcriptional regulator [Clostridiales bacterium]
MIPVLRRQQLLELLPESEVVLLTDLIEKVNISESTLRRDLKELELQGDIEMLRGGGVRLKKEVVELDLNEKISLNKEEKERIVQYAANLINPNDVVFLDPSSLNLLMVDYIKSENVTVVTNSIATCNKLVSRNIKCILVGGEIKVKTSSCIGPIADQILSGLRFSKSFLGANGISVENGITNHDLRERSIKRIAINNSVNTYFLIDSSKYEVVAMCKIAEIDECNIITGKKYNEFDKLENIIVV